MENREWIIVFFWYTVVSLILVRWYDDAIVKVFGHPALRTYLNSWINTIIPGISQIVTACRDGRDERDDRDGGMC